MNPFQKMRENHKKLPYELAAKLFSYDPLTGIVTQKMKQDGHRKVGSPVGYIGAEGYLETSVDGTNYKLHRVCWLIYYGFHPENILDHINKRKDDNRICNLREVSVSCNGRNCNLDVNNKSGITGVCWHKVQSMWMSSIYENKKIVHLGYHADKKDAAMARWNAEKKYGWEYCCTESTAYLYLKLNGVIK